MSEYLWWCGLVANIAVAMFALLVVWVWFIWPFVEALSITRCLIHVSKAYGGKPSAKDILRTFKQHYCDFLFGRSCTRIYNGQFEWEGFGKWRVYNNEGGDK